MKLKMNPVFRKDALAGSRGYSLPLMVTALNFLLVLLFLCNLFFVSSESAETGEIAYTAFLRGCHIIAYAELVLLLLAAPALAAVSVLSVDTTGHVEMSDRTIDEIVNLSKQYYNEWEAYHGMKFLTYPD